MKTEILTIGGEKSIAIINAKDIDVADTLKDKSASCLIKMTEADFAAFKQAFFRPGIKNSPQP